MSVSTKPAGRPTLRERTFAHPERWFSAGTFFILLVTALKLASAFFLPVVASALLALLLAPPVRWLSKRGLPAGVAAAMIVTGLVVVVGLGVFSLARPAAAWLSRAPETMEQAREKIQRIAHGESRARRHQETGHCRDGACGHVREAAGNDHWLPWRGVDGALPNLLSAGRRRALQ